MIFGFGSVEQSAEEEAKRLIIAGLLRGESIHDICDRYNEPAKRYDKMPKEEVPERYSKVYYYEDALHFLHTHRRCAMSPDGWAMLRVDYPLGTDS